ncbi:response regulator [Bremerella sp. JC817]|uniref:response regulator n=1 Tax=Bremerella sp. JC817 TaxID=3231756 RepID=UPI00345A2990
MLKSHILIVDDSPQDRDAIVSALRQDHRVRYKFTEVTTGGDGLKLLDERVKDFDLVFLDYRLPDMDATGFVRRLLGDATIPPVPIVLITGSLRSFDSKILEHGVQDFFGKSHITAEILPRIAQNAIERHKLLKGLVESEERAAQAMLAAEQANRAKSQFLASLSHELRTPLAAIIGFAELLEKDPSAPDAQKMLGMIASSGEHLLSLLNDLLDIAKVEAGTLEIETMANDICHVVESTCELMKFRAIDKGLRFHWHLPKNCPVLARFDPVRLRQVLINLIGNAIKYTDHGEVECLIQYDYVNEMLKIRVSDTGPGVHADVIDRIFTPFSQGPASSEQKRIGIGLGLAISRQLAVMMGGSLTLEKTSSEGSCFMLELHAPEASSDDVPSTNAANHQRPAASVSWEQKSVLVAEDVEANRFLLEKIFAKFGIEPIFAHDGKQACDIVETRRQQGSHFDLVLLDMQMPVMDGYEAASYLKSIDYPSPIVALTAAAVGSDVERCTEAGCAQVLVKPLRFDELKRTLQHYWG